MLASRTCVAYFGKLVLLTGPYACLGQAAARVVAVGRMYCTRLSLLCLSSFS